MPKKVRIPTPLRKLTNNEELVEINAATIGEALVELQTRFPGIQERLVDDQGEVRRFVNVYVGTRRTSASSKPRDAACEDGDEIRHHPRYRRRLGRFENAAAQASPRLDLLPRGEGTAVVRAR